jgi:hypothetical protein
MLQMFAIIGCAIVFTVIGLGAGIAVVLNLPDDFRDHEGVATALMVLLPAAGGLVAGVVVGLIAASFSPPPTPKY